jgi:hypothetical protein
MLYLTTGEGLMTGVEMLEFIMRLLFNVKLRFCDGDVNPAAANQLRQKKRRRMIVLSILALDLL